jgi:hypothetical protein
MWYIDGHKWDADTYSQEVDEMLNNPAMAEAVMGLTDSHGMLIEGRCHGNPFLDTDTIGWEDHTDQKRAENDAYRAEEAADKPIYGFKNIFQKVPPAEKYVQGSFYIIGIDEPEYAERGEMYIHERLTSHLAEPITQPKSEWEPWMHYVYDDYIDDIFIKNLAYGQIPSPIIVEPQRQRMGLPYEWFGAPIE